MFQDIFMEHPNAIGLSSYSILAEHASDVLGAGAWPGELPMDLKMSRKDLELLASEFDQIQQWASAIQFRIAAIQDRLARQKEKKMQSKRISTKKVKK